MSDDPFESAKFSLRRASRHVQDFNAAAREFMEAHSYTVRHEFNADTGLYEIKVKLIRDIPEDLRGYASDAVKNIRDALDQAMSAATFVVIGSRKRRAHFPFGESADNLEDSLTRRKAPQCRDIPEELFPAIRHIRPYPYEGDEFRLKTLQTVSGPHKHSVSLTLGAATPMPFEEVRMRTSDGEEIVIHFPEWDSTKEEAVVATHSGDGKLDLSAAFHIAFAHPALKNTPASHAMDRWGVRTEWIIKGLEKFSAQVVAERGA